MGRDEGVGRLRQLRDGLWKNKITIALVLTLLIAIGLAATTYYFHAQSNERAVQLSDKTADYDALNGSHNDLTATHLALVASNENLTERYTNLTYQYKSLTSNQSSLAAAYEGLNASVGRIQEKGGPVIALYYKKYQGGARDDPKIFVDATAYNLGDKAASRFTIKCRVIYAGQPSVNVMTFTNVMPLDKRSYSWSFSPLTEVDSVWIE